MWFGDIGAARSALSEGTHHGSPFCPSLPLGLSHWCRDPRPCQVPGWPLWAVVGNSGHWGFLSSALDRTGQTSFSGSPLCSGNSHFLYLRKVSKNSGQSELAGSVSPAKEVPAGAGTRADPSPCSVVLTGFRDGFRTLPQGWGVRSGLLQVLCTQEAHVLEQHCRVP